MIAYGRFCGDDRGVVVVNSTGLTKRVRIPVWQIDVRGESLRRIMKSTEVRYNVGQVTYPLENGVLTFEIPAHCSVIFEEKTLDF